jgi:CRISPR-associated Cas5-like protein
MRLLRFDLNVPFWCSFAEYGTTNIQQTHLFPPPPTIFGMLLNALRKPAIHTITDDNAKQRLIEEYLYNYSKLRFSIVIRDMGEKIDDYLNILKGNRKIEYVEADLKNKIIEKLEFNDLEINKKELNKTTNKLKRQHISDVHLKNIMKLLKQRGATIKEINELFDFIEKYWRSLPETLKYEMRKYWLRSQVNRQRLIRPMYSIYIQSSDKTEEYSIENISAYLSDSKRPLYLGESDDVFELRVYELIEVESDNNKSSQISSVLPGLYRNSQLVNVPVKLRYDPSEKHKLLCSIPHGDLGEDVPCINVFGENIVFL